MHDYDFDSGKFARLIRAKRGSTGLRELETDLGISASTISRLERLVSLPDMSTLIAICDWLETPPSSFFVAKGQTEVKISPLDTITDILLTNGVEGQNLVVLQVLIKAGLELVQPK